MKALIIDDAPDIVEVVSLCFEMRWPEVIVVSAAEGGTGLALVESQRPDIVILDVGLPDLDGFEVLRRIRKSSAVPVIMLTVREEEGAIVKALELGADDYITKPFSHIELLARVQAVLRRTGASQKGAVEPPLVCGNLTIDLANHRVSLNSEVLRLTPLQYRLLYHLVKNSERVLTHQELLDKVWGEHYNDSPEYIKVHIQRLRQKLGDNPVSPKMIVNERGVGYRFVRPE